MAFDHRSGLLLLFKLGDDESPEQFTALCSMTAKTIGHQGTENTFDIPPCPSADEIAWLVSEIQNKRITVQFSGLLHAADYDVFYAWWDSGESKNAQIVVDIPAASGGRILSGAFKLPSFDLTGNRGEKMTVSGTIASDGEVIKTNNT